MMGGWGMAAGGLGIVLMIAFWIVIIVGAVWLLSNLFPNKQDGSSADRSDRPLDILKRRYARGELSREEFEEMRGDLE